MVNLYRQRQLKAYKQVHGDCNVQRLYEINKELGNCVSHQRIEKNNKKLGQHCINMLRYLGLVWDLYEADWMKNYVSLTCFCARQKNTDSHA